MSSKDKTRQKLVGSMRKTKVVAGIGTDSARKESGADRSEPADSARPPAATGSAKAAPATGKPRGADGYQSGRRVWPD